jgi:fimbrial chaperone protein
MLRTAKAAFLGLTAAVCLASSMPSLAHEVQPMIAKVTPSGSGASFRLMIRNTDAVPITLEISPYRVAVDEAGNAVRTAEEADVILFPPQTIVQPGGEQAIQVRYVGDPAITEGRLYAVVVGQLPVDFTTVNNSDASQTQVKIGFDFVSHVVVQPETARANLEITPVTRQANGDLSFAVSNTGNGVALLRDAEFSLTAGGQPLVIASDNVDFGAFGAILPGGRRDITITAANAPGMTGNVTAAITLK